MVGEVLCSSCAAVLTKPGGPCAACGAPGTEPERPSRRRGKAKDPSQAVTTLDDTMTDEDDEPPAPAEPALPPAGTDRIESAEVTGTGSTPRASLIGTKVADYLIEARLGGGAMGVVYKATHALIGKAVAIKVLRPDVSKDLRDVDRLLDEARVISTIKHRGIIDIFGAGTLEDGRNYLIMELLEGEALEKRMKRQATIPAAETVAILEQVLAALAAAHEAGVVHRDLKPGNVFLVKEGASFYVKLLDFGLARRNQKNVTRIAGTPDYISPEHARGRPAGPAADLYAFGVLCFRMLTGRLPFSGPTPLQVMHQHVHTAPPVPRELNKEIPKALSELILKLMAKEPGNRPDAAQVKAELRLATAQMRTAITHVGMAAVIPPAPPSAPRPQAQREESSAEHQPVAAQTGDFKRSFRSAWPWLLGAVVGMWCFVALAYFFWPSRPQPVASPVIGISKTSPQDENADAPLDALAVSARKSERGIDQSLGEMDSMMRDDSVRRQAYEKSFLQVKKGCDQALTGRQIDACEVQLLRLRRRFDR